MNRNEQPPGPEPNSGLLTTAEVADYLRVPARTVEAWRYKGTGPRGLRIGKHVRYRREDVDRWLDGRHEEQLS